MIHSKYTEKIYDLPIKGYFAASRCVRSASPMTYPVRFSDRNILYVKQCHSGKVSCIEDAHADGLYFNSMKRMIGIHTSDCVPVYFFGCDYREVGIIHAGRRGIHAGIFENMFQNLRSKEVVILIGPSICKHCYEVQEDFLSDKKHDLYNGCAINHNQRWIFDLRKACENRVDASGLRYTLMHDYRCTNRSEELSSYRAGKHGTIVSIAEIIA